MYMNIYLSMNKDLNDSLQGRNSQEAKWVYIQWEMEEEKEFIILGNVWWIGDIDVQT